jgi:hypothetical protein
MFGVESVIDIMNVEYQNTVLLDLHGMTTLYWSNNCELMFIADLRMILEIGG